MYIYGVLLFALGACMHGMPSTVVALPETTSLPSVLDFAACFLLGAQQRGYLSSAREKALGKHLALGKEVVCRVPSTRQNWSLPSVILLTLGKGRRH